MPRPKSTKIPIKIKGHRIKDTIALRELAMKLVKRSPVQPVRVYEDYLHGQLVKVRVIPPGNASGLLYWKARPLSGQGRGPD